MMLVTVQSYACGAAGESVSKRGASQYVRSCSGLGRIAGEDPFRTTTTGGRGGGGGLHLRKPLSNTIPTFSCMYMSTAHLQRPSVPLVFPEST